MKRIGNLFNKVVSLENLIEADEKARKGKLKSYGVKVHDKNRMENLQKLHNVLSNGEYHTSKYSIFKIHEPKEREIYRLPYYPDRIVHHAIMNILESIWVSIFTSDTCSCIKKRGIMEAHRRISRYLKDIDGTRYCLKTDIRKYYPSINHDCLKVIIRKKIKDKRLLMLLDEIIDSAEGVPIGNYLSQYFANLYLAYVDHRIKEELHVKYYVRYADDMVFLATKKEKLATILQLYHNQTLIRKSIKQSFARKCAYLNRKNVSDKQYKQGIASWLGWAKYSNSHHLKSKMIKKKI